jgi:CheY-like chemotaxis protein
MSRLLLDRRIFVIEDGVANQTITYIILHTAGAIMESDRWGFDVVKKMLAFKPIDLVILDLMFPENVTGYDIFEQIRSHPEFETVPIVAVSAADPADAIPRTKSLGFAGFIRKPLNTIRFTEQIAQLLSGEAIWER